MKRWYANPYVIVITVISLMGIAVSSLLFLLVPPPTEILSTMFHRLTAVRTFHVEASVRWRGENGGKAEAAEYVTSGTFDRTDQDSLSGQEAFSLRVGAMDPAVFSGTHLMMGGTSRAPVHFVRFDAAPDRVGALHLAEHRGTWLRADLGMLLTQTQFPGVGGRPVPLSDAARALLATDFARTPFLTLVDALKAEKLGGEDVNHFAVRPEMLLIKDAYVSREQARLGRELTAKERQAADTFFADMAPQDGEIWIGKRDGLPHRLRLRFAYDDGTRKGTLDITADISAYGAPVTVQAPQDAVEDVTPLLASILASLREHLPLAKDGSANRAATAADSGSLPALGVFAPGSEDPDYDGLSDALEGFYGTNARVADTDGDGMNDGDEITANRNPAGDGALFDFAGGRFQ